MSDIVKAGGALAIRADQTEWTPAQAAVLQQSGISNEVTAAELSGFLHLCQRTELDPFSRQIYLIGRWDGRSNRTVFTPQTGIDGYRVVAHRVVATSREAFGYEDTLWCDQQGRWRDVWLSSEPPAAAKVTVLRNGQRFPAIALFSEYVQTNKDGKYIGLWRKMPAGQLAKCAEALALRKAFPHDLAGVYTAEEMAQADNPAPAPAPSRPQHLQPVPQPDEGLPQHRDFISEATEAQTADEVRALWVGARAEGAPEEYLQQIADIGQQKLAGEPVDAELVDEHDEWAAALHALETAATAAGLTPQDLEEGFQAAHGVPTTEATVEALQQMTAILKAGAA